LSRTTYPAVIIVMLRRPKSSAEESRTDPYWEFGSFGTTGCHNRSVMNPLRIKELDGKRFAFAQGGPLGFRLVHVTPPLSTRQLPNGLCEALWAPPDMPLLYKASPCLIDNSGHSDCPSIIPYFSGVKRHTWEARFGSAFRTSRLPLAGVVGAELLRVYSERRLAFPSAVAQTYVDALPYPPPRVDDDEARRRGYESRIRREGCQSNTRRRGYQTRTRRC
jgi:hypothetical protein